MKKLIAAALLMCSASAFADCESIMPGGEPQIPGSIRLCRAQEAYLTVYNPYCKVPYYSAEIITARSIGGNRRGNNFREDPALDPSVRSTLNDYKKTGFDRGHLAPAADFSYSASAMSESFLLSNMIPQYHNPNAGIWSEAEAFAREKAMQQPVRVISGPMFETLPVQYIGNGVCVPTSTFKIVIEPNGRSTSFVVPNIKKIPKEAHLYEFEVPKEEIERRLGISFD
ncbi:Nuclease precursor [compost metagenome]